MTDAGLRAPPVNFEAEQALLGAIMLNNRAFEKVSDFLLPEHFAEPAHIHIYAAMCRLISEDRPATPVTLTPILADNPALADLGGAQAYLAALVGAVVSIVNAEDYGRLIFEAHLRRELIALGTDLVNDAYQPLDDITPIDQIEGAETRLYEILSTTAQKARGGLSHVAGAAQRAVDAIDAAHRNPGSTSGLPTGLRDLDRRTGGLHPSDLIILAGRPSMGKTALATTIAYHVAQSGERVAMFELEMSDDQLAHRIICSRANVDSSRARNGEICQAEFDRIFDAQREMERLPLFIDQTPALTIAAIRSRARRMARKGGLGLVIVDHIGLATPPDLRAGKTHQIEAITNALKVLAKDLNVPVIALSQLSRAVEMREDKRPQLSDLRDSGAIEQDADVVMFVYREQYYLERAEPARKPEESDEKFNERFARWQERCEQVWNTAEAIIGKNRHGSNATVKLGFDGPRTWFHDIQGEQ